MNRGRTRLLTSAVALSCALGGTLLTAGPASADSRGYYIYNLSSYPLRLERADRLNDYRFGFEGRPSDGAVLMPGAGPHRWEVGAGVFDHWGTRVVYRMIGSDKGLLYVDLHNPPGVDGRESTCESKGPRVDCTLNNPGELTVTDPPGTVREIPSGKSQEQAELLRGLCREGSRAKCTFTPVSRTPLVSNDRIAGNPVANCTDDDADKRFIASDKVAVTNSLEFGVTAKLTIEKIAEVGVEARYGHEWTTEHEWSEEVTMRLKPGHIGWATHTAPILRDRGDFILTLANTTWYLRDVYFDSADLTPRDDPRKKGGFAIHDSKMTADHLKATCPERSSGLKRAPASSVPMDWAGTRRADTLLAGIESHTIRGFGGNDLMHGGAGHDTLYAGRGSDNLDGGMGHDKVDGGPGPDVLHGGPGRDTLDGGPGADTIIDRSGPTLVEIGPDTGPGTDTVHVRDGRGDDTVFCGSRSSTVAVDAGDDVIGACGKVSRGRPNEGQAR